LGVIRVVAVQILKSLKFLRVHNLIHCDLKPENILLRSMNRHAIKVIDFGSSCFVDERVYTYIQVRSGGQSRRHGQRCVCVRQWRRFTCSCSNAFPFLQLRTSGPFRTSSPRQEASGRCKHLGVTRADWQLRLQLASGGRCDTSLCQVQSQMPYGSGKCSHDCGLAASNQVQHPDVTAARAEPRHSGICWLHTLTALPPPPALTPPTLLTPTLHPQSRFYRSPEVILGLHYGCEIDMWSFGCILAELLTGYPLFPGEDETEQLACIMEVQGLPAQHLLAAATRRKMFFDSNNAPRLVPNSRGESTVLASRRVASVTQEGEGGRQQNTVLTLRLPKPTRTCDVSTPQHAHPPCGACREGAQPVNQDSGRAAALQRPGVPGPVGTLSDMGSHAAAHP